MATMKNKVIWQEGLFALPQHFQQQQRHCEYLLTRRLMLRVIFSGALRNSPSIPNCLPRAKS